LNYSYNLCTCCNRDSSCDSRKYLISISLKVFATVHRNDVVKSMSQIGALRRSPFMYPIYRSLNKSSSPRCDLSF